MKQAVIFGAGNVGRGFIGQLFSESGYVVTFVDIDRPLIVALNARHGYTVRLIDNDYHQDVWITPVSALPADDTPAIAEAVAQADLLATAVGARALPLVAASIAQGVRQRMRRHPLAPLNCIVCENLHGAAGILGGLIAEHLSEDEQAFLRQHVGLVDTVIGRMIPPPTPEQRAQDIGLIQVEPYKELPIDRTGWVGNLPDIVAMQPCDHFEVYTARKLYIHNCGHATLAYLGYQRGHTYGYEALADPVIADALERVWQESIAGLAGRYHVAGEWLFAHTADLRRRFANRALGDTVFRLGRDPLRKLAPQDRLVGPARLAEQASIQPVELARVIAAALRFDHPDDPLAGELQKRLSEQGLRAVLAEVCQIAPHESLAVLIEQQWQSRSILH